MIKTLPMTYILKKMSGVFFSEEKNDRMAHDMCDAGLYLVTFQRGGRSASGKGAGADHCD